MFTVAHPWVVFLTWLLVNLAERASAGLQMKVEFINEAGGPCSKNSKRLCDILPLFTVGDLLPIRCLIPQIQRQVPSVE